MRGLNRNKRLVFYALRIGEQIELDEYGNETGELTTVYGEPVELMCNISAATGLEVAQVFGTTAVYNRVICVSDGDCPIDEDTVVWFGKSPSDGTYNYIVVKKADSKNGILYALREVNVT